MNEFPVYSNEDLRRKLIRHTGPKLQKPTKTTPKSTKFALTDIFMLAKVNNLKRFYDFIKGRTTFGPTVRKRLSRIVFLIDNGYMTKSQQGAYHFHDEPQKGHAVIEMKVTLGVGGLKLGIGEGQKAPPKFPDFDKIFGR